MDRASWMGYPNSSNLFKVTAVLWQRITYHDGNVGFGLPLVVFNFLYPAIAPSLRSFLFPNDRALEIVGSDSENIVLCSRR